jgi:hypothetical protein
MKAPRLYDGAILGVDGRHYIADVVLVCEPVPVMFAGGLQPDESETFFLVVRGNDTASTRIGAPNARRQETLVAAGEPVHHLTWC